MKPTRRTSKARSKPQLVLRGGWALAAVACAACASEGTEAGGAKLTPSDFRAASAEPPRSPDGPQTTRSIQNPAPSDGAFQPAPGDGGTLTDARPSPAAPPRDRTRQIPVAPVLNVTAVPGNPAPPDESARAIGAPVVVDSLVGQVNGRPIFAAEFFEPIDGFLRAEADRLGPDEWSDSAKKAIYEQLGAQVRDQLILDEARSRLTPEQRQGLLFFLEKIREDVVTNVGRGSARQAERELEQAEGISLQERAQRELDVQLIRKELSEKVTPRVIVSWRDVRLAYEQREGEYNPPSVAHLRMIWTRASDQEAVDRVREALASGTPFAEVAATPDNRFNRPNAGALERPVTGTYADTEFFPQGALNEPAQSLTPGETVGPFLYEPNSVQVWLTLERIEDPDSRSLYDVQLELFEYLRGQKFSEERTRYFSDLLQRASVTKIEDMVDRLLVIAEERYLGQAQ